MSDSFNLIFVSPDQDKTAQLIHKIKKKFESIPLDIRIAIDGQKAILEFDRKPVDLIIADRKMPIISGEKLADEIRKREGSTYIYLLDSVEDFVIDVGIEVISYPIKDWTSFYNKIEESVPEEIKTKFGLKKKDSLMIKLLNEYKGNKFDVQNQDSAPTDQQIYNFVPKFFDRIDTSMKQEIKEQKQQQETQLSGPSLTEKVLLGTLPFITGILFYVASESNSIITKSLPWVMSFITAMSFFGHFLGVAIGKILFKPKN